MFEKLLTVWRLPEDATRVQIALVWLMKPSTHTYVILENYAAKDRHQCLATKESMENHGDSPGIGWFSLNSHWITSTKQQGKQNIGGFRFAPFSAWLFVAKHALKTVPSCGTVFWRHWLNPRWKNQGLQIHILMSFCMLAWPFSCSARCAGYLFSGWLMGWVLAIDGDVSWNNNLCNTHTHTCVYIYISYVCMYIFSDAYMICIYGYV